MTDRNLLTELRDVQQGRCGICGVTGKLDIDHDHHSGMVRGLLCHPCNVTEGKHGPMCPTNTDCAICRWRVRPAVSWVGWTEIHERAGDWFGSQPWHRPWRPSSEPPRKPALDAWLTSNGRGAA